MGCCHSRVQGPDSDVDPPDAVPRQSQSANQNQSISPPRATPRSGLPTSSTRPNQPLRAPSPLARSPKNVSNVLPPWTRSHLEKERQIFFETRVSGNLEVWTTLGQVCLLLRQNNLPDAQAILDATNISCPNGRFARGRGRSRDGRGKGGGVYDAQGLLYDIPDWVVVDPADIIEEEHEKEIDAGSDGAEDEVYEDKRDGIGPASPGKEDKGKGRADEVDMGEKVKVRCRLSTSQGDLLVDYWSRQPARYVAERIKEMTGQGKVKLMFMGKVVDEGKPLGECGWTGNHIVSVFVLNE
ncbi:hypothetical protein DOTSEDRAFT_68901 [Dothistroma septosporum NZE10]|uniref:DC-UbP/UBTD2 N-terminal domain-containing protein n=1 Tax=Dothistroma septosporum (strain NZE10 / CBS 128990) TaxID=675120 RepID=N1Q5D4_DOTSN|nr:hypothetical protein DOTSEDRAFT_68901 [Dothistroma septosporum NZE10]